MPTDMKQNELNQRTQILRKEFLYAVSKTQSIRKHIAAEFDEFLLY